MLTRSQVKKQNVEPTDTPYCACEQSEPSSADIKEAGQQPNPLFNMAENILEAITTLQDSFNEWKETEEGNYEDTATRLGAIEGQMRENNGITGSRGLFKPLKNFCGTEDEDVDEFITSLTQLAAFQNWDEDRVLQALPLFLGGNARIWFNAYDRDGVMGLADILTALREQFNPEVNKWLNRQKLDRYTQGPNTSLSEYTAQVRRLCQRLELPKTEWLHHFMRGLKPTLKAHVYLQQPKTFEESEYAARLKESAPDPNPSMNAIMSQVSNIVSDLKAITIHSQQEKPRVVSALNQPPRPSWNSCETTPRYSNPNPSGPVLREDLHHWHATSAESFGGGLEAMTVFLCLIGIGALLQEVLFAILVVGLAILASAVGLGTQEFPHPTEGGPISNPRDQMQPRNATGSRVRETDFGPYSPGEFRDRFTM